MRTFTCVERIYEIFTTEEFDKDFNKLDKSIRYPIEKEINKLKTNPYSGRPLGYKFFREKKIKNYRFYYLIYESQIVIFAIAISDKKDQQEVIDTIKSMLPYYREEIKKKLSSLP